jgi:ATP-dependent DNA helicase RecG
MPEPIIEEYAGGIQITFLKDIYTEEYLRQLDLDERLIKALLYIKEHKSITNAQYQILLGVSKRTATYDLQLLTEQGFLIKTGTRGPSTSYRLNYRNGQ